jgi:hypothetical protein
MVQHRHTSYDPDCHVCVANLPAADDYSDILREGARGLVWAILKAIIGILIICAALWLITLPARAEVRGLCSEPLIETTNGRAGVVVAIACTAASVRFRSAIAPTACR